MYHIAFLSASNLHFLTGVFLHFITGADTEVYDNAFIDEKKVIAGYLIKAVTLTRDYGIQIEFNISEAQYLGGMEMR